MVSLPGTESARAGTLGKPCLAMPDNPFPRFPVDLAVGPQLPSPVCETHGFRVPSGKHLRVRMEKNSQQGRKTSHRVRLSVLAEDRPPQSDSLFLRCRC
jgi:hypothetical protein